MYEAIANFINSIIAALQGIAKIGNVASNPLGAVFNEQNAQQSTESNTGTKTLPEKTSAPQVPSIGTRKAITIPENITARFNDTGSPAWANQPGGRHLGTDFGAPNGSAVYAPYDMRIIKIGHYDDEGRKGDYVMGTLGDGTEYYSGHLANPRVTVGQFIKAGTQIAVIGYYNHTHIQLRVAGQLYDYEQYIKSH